MALEKPSKNKLHTANLTESWGDLENNKKLQALKI